MGLDFSQGLEEFSRIADPALDKPISVDMIVSRIDALGADLAQSEASGLFVPLPQEKPDTSKDISRIKTIRNRLSNLGYLPNDSGQPYLDEDLKQAIRWFQKEAELVVDGWVGEQTWTALQELVSFERSINLLRWFRGGQIKTPLKRAIGLRLFVLGLMEKAPASHPVDPTEGIEAFGRVWQILNLGPVISRASISLEWVARLFDQDGLIGRLADTKVPLTASDQQLTHGFILNTAKIELWLAGYKVRPSGYDLQSQTKGDDEPDSHIWMISSSMTKYMRLKKNMSFYKALLSFWKDHDVESDQIKGLTADFIDTFPRFFQMIAKEIQADAIMTPMERQAQIEGILQKYPEQIPSIWDNIRKMGNRVWDGIRRVWGWLRTLIQTGLKKVIALGSNLSRLIYDYALSAYSVVSNVFKSFDTLVRSIASPVADGSDLKYVVMFHDNDFDFRAIVNSSAESKDVRAFAGNVRRQTRMFIFACHVVRVATSVTMGALRSGMTGSIALVFAMIRSKAKLDRINGLIKQYQLAFGE